MSSPSLWTSTQFHNWKADCAKFVANHQDFEVRDIYTSAQEKFCVDFCEFHRYTREPQKFNVICTQPASN